jgi:hypothetical protein
MVGKDGMIGSAKFVLTGFAIGLADSAVIIALRGMQRILVYFVLV